MLHVAADGWRQTISGLAVVMEVVMGVICAAIGG